MPHQPFVTLVFFFVSYSWFRGFSQAILPTHFWREGLSLTQMILGTLFLFGAQLGILLVLRKFWAKTAWHLALWGNLVYLLLVIKINYPFQYYLASVVNGLTIYLFFLFYNLAHFTHTAKDRVGSSCGVMFSVGSLVSVGSPLLAGFLGQISMNLVWLFSLAFFLLAYSQIRRQQNFHFSYDVGAALAEIKATRIFVFLEGIWEALVFAVIPVYTLHFIKAPLVYGTFMAYLSLMSVAANLLLGHATDKLRRRAVFLYPITFVLAGATFLFALAAENFTLWFIASGILQFFLPLFWNISTAMVIDAHTNLKLAIPGREITLAFGRVLGLIPVFLSFSLEPRPYLIFLLLGSVMALYPFVLLWNSRIKKRYSYL